MISGFLQKYVLGEKIFYAAIHPCPSSSNTRLCPAHCGEEIYNLWRLWRPKNLLMFHQLKSILIDSSWLLNRSTNSVGSSFKWVQMKNTSSMNLNITSGLHLAFFLDFLLQISHENIGKIGCIFFAHGSARSLEKPSIIKHKIIMQ